MVGKGGGKNLSYLIDTTKSQTNGKQSLIYTQNNEIIKRDPTVGYVLRWTKLKYNFTKDWRYFTRDLGKRSHYSYVHSAWF